MELFRYYGYMYGERIVGIVKANTLQEAKEILKNTYDDYDMWSNKTVEKAVFHNNVCEVYYGC